MFELDILAAALLATVICVNAAPARADDLGDLFAVTDNILTPPPMTSEQRMINAIESVPLQQAQWDVTIRAMESYGRGYTPTMSQTNF
jgi:hypothetical protein